MDQAHPAPARQYLSHEDCIALPALLGRIADKWTVLVIGHLSEGPLRYKELHRAIEGISQRMLTLTLKGLEEDGLVLRTVFPTVPPRVDYELTPLGRTLIDALGTVHRWVLTHRSDLLAARRAYAERKAAET